MSQCKPGSVSKDFPLYHTNLIPTYENPSDRKHTHIISPNRNSFTNEHPEIFRLEGMKERGYFNPYINESIKVDRSEYLKKLSSDRKNINFIDFLKSNRKYSQDPKIIRYITVDVNKELKHKRMNRNNLSQDYSNNIALTEGNINKKNNYNLLEKKLNYYIPKINYRITSTFVSDNSENIKNKKIFNSISYNKPTDLKNFSNFNFTDMEKKTNDEIYFNRKLIRQYNPIKDKMETISPPPYKNYKWSSFLENYFLMANSGKKFLRKGGLFSEFCNKNINSIKNNKYQIQQDLKLKREQKEKENNLKKEKNKENEKDKSIVIKEN